MTQQPFRELELAEYSAEREDRLKLHSDCVASEVPVALVYNEISHAVLMATPQNLTEFAMGFSFTEGIISSPDEVFDTEIINSEAGIEVHLTLASERFNYLKERKAKPDRSYWLRHLWRGIPATNPFATRPD